MKDIRLTQKYLKELLHYNPNTGIFTWKVAKNSHAKVGDIAGYKKISDLYIAIKIDSKKYFAHRLAFLYVYGNFPKRNIDHINHIRDDNRIINLREVTHSENQRNSKKRKDNKSGFTGVCRGNNKNKWVAQIKANGKVKHLGIFRDKKDAIRARQEANIKYGYHPNHGK